VDANERSWPSETVDEPGRHCVVFATGVNYGLLSDGGSRTIAGMNGPGT
jgi:hypothetical protein